MIYNEKYWIMNHMKKKHKILVTYPKNLVSNINSVLIIILLLLVNLKSPVMLMPTIYDNQC